MEEYARTLADLRPGMQARVAGLEGVGALRRRLLELGLTPGATVTLLRAAPLGDPLQVRLRGYALALRRADAARVRLAPPYGARS